MCNQRPSVTSILRRFLQFCVWVSSIMRRLPNCSSFTPIVRPLRLFCVGCSDCLSVTPIAHRCCVGCAWVTSILCMLRQFSVCLASVVQCLLQFCVVFVCTQHRLRHFCVVFVCTQHRLPHFCVVCSNSALGTPILRQFLQFCVNVEFAVHRLR